MEAVRAEFEPATFRAFEACELEGQPVERVASELETAPASVYVYKKRVPARLRRGGGADRLTNRCLGDAALDRLLRGSAPRVRGWFWRRHLRRCPQCRARYAEREDDRRLVTELRGALSSGPTTNPPR